MERPICAATTKEGTPCRAFAMPGRDVCHNHAPEMGEWRKARNANGGRNRSNIHRAAAAMPQDVRSVAEMLLRAMAATERGEMKPTTMTALAAGARAYAALHEAGILLSRVDRLESALDEDEVA